MMKKKFLLCSFLLSILILLFIFSPFGRDFTASRITKNDLDETFSFSLENGFYDEDISVSLNLPDYLDSHIKILYTTDGNRPTLDSPCYSEPLFFSSGDEIKNVTIRAILVNEATQEILAGPYTATYFVGKNATTFSNALVVSISSDKEGLYSAENGILYPMKDCGPTEEDWKQFELQNCKQRGLEWIRDAHVDIFEPDGTNVISQEIGLCVDGDHGSMTHYPFSLKILAASEYDETHPTFRYNFFSYYNTKGTNFPHMQDYNNLVFRNGGNEYNAGTSDPEQKGSMIRWQIGSRLADEYGVFVAGARPAIVYLDGELYGVTCLIDTYNRHNIGARLRLNRELMEIYKGGELDCAELGQYSDLYYAYPDVTKTPLTLTKNQTAFEEKVDITELFTFYALEMFYNNTDFPKKNVTMWRYASAEETTDSDVPYTSGKFFPLINDLDCSYDFRYDDDLRTAYLNRIKEGAALMGCSMQIPKYRGIFVNTLCDMLNSGLFDEPHMNEIIAQANEDFSQIAALYYSPEDEAQRQRNVEELRVYASERCRRVRDFIGANFETNYPYELRIDAPDAGSSIHFSTTTITNGDGSFNGTYYGDYELTLTASTNETLTFDHWEVNKQKITSQELTLTKDDIEHGKIHVKLVTKQTENPPLLISEVCANGNHSWVELYNPSNEVISLSEYSLTNSITSVFDFSLPEVSLSPGDVYVIGTDNTGVFRIASEKNIFLQKGNIICDQIAVPQTGKGESYGRNGETGDWKYYVSPTEGSAQ